MGLILVLCLYCIQIYFGVSALSHPDNALEANGLLTPLHIVPEWYFLCQYAMLKAIPSKNAGFIILLTSVSILFLLGEVRTMTTFSLFTVFVSFLWIGAQFPQETFLSYARILTFLYYLTFTCILVTSFDTLLSCISFLGVPS